MKILVNSTPLEAIGCARRHDDRITIMMRSEAPFASLASTFDKISTLTVEDIRGTKTYGGYSNLIAIHRNEGSDVVTITMQGLVSAE